MKVLVTGTLPDWVKKTLADMGYEAASVSTTAYVDEERFCEGISGFDIYISGGFEKCTKAVIEAADKLKAIVFLGSDYKSYIDVDAATKKNILVFSTPSANARAVAEFTVFLMLAAARKASKMIVDAYAKTWAEQTGFELQGKTLGLIGSGAIAAHVAKIAEGLGMRVIYWTRSGKKQGMQGLYAEFDDLLAQSEILSLHVPDAAGTILDAVAFSKMNKCKVLVNTARAALVDAEVLYEFLKSGSLKTAAFDGFYGEGASAWTCPEARLFDLGPDRFFITPHAAWKTCEADDNMFKMALAHIRKL